MEKGGGGGAAPTGCYKCGRPGHWSRDCPSNPSNGNNPNNSTSTPHNTYTSTRKSAPYPSNSSAGGSSSKLKMGTRTRPKLTADSLLSDDGLGHILRHFPRAFKYHGRGHEVTDLRNLLGLYADWHSRLLPYYSFDQFVHKVEEVGSSKRVKLCLRDLRERVANGVDPAKLHEPEVQEQISNKEQENRSLEEPNSLQKDGVMNLDGDVFEQEMIHQVWENAMKEPTHEPQRKSDESGSKEPTSGNVASDAEVIGISEEQRARMEANKLKALQKAAIARAARSAQPHAL
ncbi:PREDICTED: TIMELESS-interacting protein [Ipomoea nil]|uniref:TIMELESS-interacting protein n=1 Tax=Ipomoea nil TaxID=35883 RepID=UPI000900D61B|nr:PREDICTED: TIMELESS-interacting protein [Ipomoea nil]